METWGSLSCDSSNKFTVITVVNWGEYQALMVESVQQNDHQSVQQVSNKCPAPVQQVSTNNKEIGEQGNKGIRKEKATVRRSPSPVTPIALTPEQEQTLTTLSEFLTITDSDHAWIKKIGEQFPKVDLADVAWQLSMWLQENPYELNKPKLNPKSRFRNWVAGADKREQWRKPVNPSQRAQTPEEDEVERKIREALIQ